MLFGAKVPYHIIWTSIELHNNIATKNKTKKKTYYTVNDFDFWSCDFQ